MKLQLDLSAQEVDAVLTAIKRSMRQAADMVKYQPAEAPEAIRWQGLLRNVRDVIEEQVDAHQAKYGVDPR